MVSIQNNIPVQISQLQFLDTILEKISYKKFNIYLAAVIMFLLALLSYTLYLNPYILGKLSGLASHFING